MKPNLYKKISAKVIVQDETSSEKLDQVWEAETTTILRKSTLTLFDFYKSAWMAAVKSQKRQKSNL